MVSYVNVDYQKLDEIIKRRGTNRSKCAAAIGVSPGAIANSFKRSSKMKITQLRVLADFLLVTPLELIPKDEWGNPLHYSDWEIVTSSDNYAPIDQEENQIMINSIIDLFSNLNVNSEGKSKIFSILCEVSELIQQIPKYAIDAPDPTTEKEL